MKASTFQSQRSKGVNVAVQASYDGLFSVSGGFNMDSTQQEAASNFSKNVETKTITVGAPPAANGDANTWASTVKDSPIPMEYKLVSIEKLFSKRYMDYLNVNYLKISGNMMRLQSDYCNYLKKDGQVENCKPITPGLHLYNTKLKNPDTYTVFSCQACTDYWLQRIDCKAISYRTSCTEDQQVCYTYTGEYMPADTVDTNDEWQSIIFISSITDYLTLDNTYIVVTTRANITKTDQSYCVSYYVTDPHCIAYTTVTTKDNIFCNLYKEIEILGLKASDDAVAGFVPPQMRL